ncbi:TPA: hypothetical protein ACGOSR_002135 [Streptococcus suis]
MKQTNVENFRTRTDGKNMGMKERHYFPNKYNNLNAREEEGKEDNECS